MPAYTVRCNVFIEFGELTLHGSQALIFSTLAAAYIKEALE